MTPRWPRLQHVLLPGNGNVSAANDIRHTIYELIHKGSLPGPERDRRWRLQRLLESPAMALKALEDVTPLPEDPNGIKLVRAYNKAILPARSSRRGRPPTRQAVALAYAVRKRLLGRGKANVAAASVARRWKPEKPDSKQVKDAYTDYRDFADREISSILRQFGRSRHNEILEAMYADLLDELAP